MHICLICFMSTVRYSVNKDKEKSLLLLNVIFMLVAFGRFLFLFWRRCGKTFGFVDDVIFAHIFGECVG